MNDNAYIEELAKIIQKYAGTEEIDADITTKAITDWHREQGLRVTDLNIGPMKEICKIARWIEHDRVMIEEDGHYIVDAKYIEELTKALIELDAAKGES